MKNMKYKLKGHESFMPREGWLSKALRLIEAEPKMFSLNYGADTLGVGANMAKAVKYWALASDLIEEDVKYSYKRSALGECIYENDRYIEDIFTLWILHINIVSNFEKATIWNLFFNAGNLEEFTKEDMIRIMSNNLANVIGTDEFSEKSLADDCTGILNMYSKARQKKYDPEENTISPFTRLRLITKNNLKYKKAVPDRDKLDEKVVLFVLNRMINSKDDRSINISDSTYGNNGLKALLNLKINDVYEYLDKLAEEGYIILNRTAGLDMIYLTKEMSDTDILNEYYNG